MGEEAVGIEVALGMAAAGRIGVSEFVDQDDLRVAGDDGVEIHLIKRLSPVFEPLAGNDLEPFEQALRLLTPVGFDSADDDIVAVPLAGPGLLQHSVLLAHAARGTTQHLHPPASIPSPPLSPP